MEATCQLYEYSPTRKLNIKNVIAIWKLEGRFYIFPAKSLPPCLLSTTLPAALVCGGNTC